MQCLSFESAWHMLIVCHSLQKKHSTSVSYQNSAGMLSAAQPPPWCKPKPICRVTGIRRGSVARQKGFKLEVTKAPVHQLFQNKGHLPECVHHAERLEGRRQLGDWGLPPRSSRPRSVQANLARQRIARTCRGLYEGSNRALVTNMSTIPTF